MTIDYDKVLIMCREMVARQESVEDILAALRKEGCSKVYSMKALVMTYGISSLEAKKVVHFSDAWKDVRIEDERFQDEF